MYRISKAVTASAFLVLSFFAVFTPAKTDKAGLKDDCGETRRYCGGTPGTSLPVTCSTARAAKPTNRGERLRSKRKT